MKEKGIRSYLIKTLNGMALGLFSSLIIGLILKQLGVLLSISFLVQIGEIAQKMMGPAIGGGVAYSLGAPPLVMLSAIVVGSIGAGSVVISEGIASINPGEPVGAFISALIATEIGKLIEGRSKVDIILVPISVIITGGLVGHFIGPYMASFISYIGELINRSTELHPFPMGIIVSVVMGMLLTLPISSAAIAISLNLSGLAAGAATVGCAANMIGFAVISYKENGFGGFIAQGIGTSMLQVPNIIRNPRIWIPPIISSAILGPISSVILKMESSAIGAGMGTSGLVGQTAMIDTVGYSSGLMIEIILMHFILPGLISLLIFRFMEKRGKISSQDMKI